MRKIILSLLTIVMVVGFSANVMGQTSDTENTNAGAVLVVPLTLAETSALHFGTILMTSTAGGTVTLSTANARAFTGGLAASAATPVSTNAAYTVTGTMNETYVLTVTYPITVTETTGAVGVNTMDISALTVLYLGDTPVSAHNSTSALSGAGTDSFIIGGLLTVKANQVAGIYAGTFDLTVDYN